jgi:hypothetical protein
MRIAYSITTAIVTDSEFVILLVIMLFHDRNGYANALQRQVICISFFLLSVTPGDAQSNRQALQDYRNILCKFLRSATATILWVCCLAPHGTIVNNRTMSEGHMSTDRSLCTDSCQNCQNCATKTNERRIEISLPSNAQTQHAFKLTLRHIWGRLLS